MKNSLARNVIVALAALSLTLAVAAGQAKVDLNKATASQLQEIPGIGPALANRIVEFREQNGPFKRIEDLMNVRGIGEKSFEKLRDRVTVGSGTEGGGKTAGGSKKAPPR